MRVQPVVEALQGRLAAFDQGGDGVDLADISAEPPLREPGKGVSKRLGGAQQPFELHMALARFDLRLAHGIRTHQRGLRVRFLQVAAYGNRLVEDRAVVQHQRRQQAPGVHGEEIFAQVLSQDDVELLGFAGDALFRHEDADAARVRRLLAVVELHRSASR